MKYIKTKLEIDSVEKLINHFKNQISKFKSEFGVPISATDFNAMVGEFMGGWNTYLTGALKEPKIEIEKALGISTNWQKQQLDKLGDTIILG